MKLNIIFIMLVMVIGLASVSALEFDNVLSTTGIKNGYPELKITNAFGLGSDLVKMSIIDANSECFIQCYVLLNITLSSPQALPYSFEAYLGNGKPTSKQFNYYTQKEDRKDVQVPHYKEVCTVKSNVSGSYNDCVTVNDYNTTKEVITYDFNKYKGEVLPAGNYVYKIEAKKSPTEKIDWTFNYLGVSAESIRNYWAWWSASWSKKKAVYINTTSIINNASALITVIWDSDMKADFGDVRFTDSTDSVEVGYWFYNNTYTDSTSVNIWLNMSGTLSPSANKTLYMYYGNPSVSTTSDITKTFLFADDFNSALDLTNIWITSNATSHTTVGGYLQAKPTAQAYYNLYSRKFFGNGYEVTSKYKCEYTSTGDGCRTDATDQNYNSATGFGQEDTRAYVPTSNVYAEIGSGTVTNNVLASNKTFIAKIRIPTSGNGNVTIYTDGGPAQATRVADPVYRNGFVSVGSGTFPILYMDWIYVRGIGTTEPVYSFGAETSSNSLAVTLNSPATSFSSSNSSITFNCSAVDETAVLNLTLIIDDIANYTISNSSANQNLSIQVIRKMAEGSHNWTCTGTDGTGSADPVTPSVRTLSIDSVPPIVNILTPTDGTTFLTTTLPKTIGFNISIIHPTGVLSSCWYYNGSVNISITCGNNVTLNLSTGYNTLAYYANDTANNLGYNSTRVYLNYLSSVAFNYTKAVTERQANIHYLNITATNISTVSATISYNNTVTNMTLDSNNGTYARFSISVTAPTVNVDSFIPVFYTYTLDGATDTTPTTNQTIYNIGNLTLNCSTPALQFILYDEETLLNLTGTFDFNFRYGTTNTSEVTTYGTYAGVTLPICINTTVSSNYTIGYGEIKYESTGYSPRRYYVFENTVINNQTQTVNLYSLSSSVQTSFKLEVESSSLDPYENIYTSLIRWYPDLNEYKIVDMGKTDETGSTVIHVKTEDVDYRIGVYEVNGTLIKLANPIRMVCLASPCTYTLRISPGDIDYTSFLNIDYTFNYNETTGIWDFVYSDTTGRTSTMNMTIYRVTNSGNFVVCTDSVTGPAGALSCNTSIYTTGTLRGEVYRSASPPIQIVQKVVSLFTSAFKGSSFGLWLSLLLALPVIFFLTLVSPVGAIIGGVVALIPALYFGSINIGIVGGFAVLAGIVAHFLKRVS